VRHTCRYPGKKQSLAAFSSTQQSLKQGRCNNVHTKSPLCGTGLPQARPHKLWGLSTSFRGRTERPFLTQKVTIYSELMEAKEYTDELLEKCVKSEWRYSRKLYFTEFPRDPMCSSWLVMIFLSSEQDSKAQACALYFVVKWRTDYRIWPIRTVWKRTPLWIHMSRKCIWFAESRRVVKHLGVNCN
jgi:hypothetical protein